eukprot:2715828-Amphidinium_carterae.1
MEYISKSPAPQTPHCTFGGAFARWGGGCFKNMSNIRKHIAAGKTKMSNWSLALLVLVVL